MTQQMFANIIVDISHEKLDRTFQYIVPQQMQGKLCTGSVVMVPFGRGDRLTKGYVTELSSKPEYELSKMKEIRELLTDESRTTGEDHLVELAAWMREMYGTTMIQALKTVLPARQKIRQKEKKVIRLLTDGEETEKWLAYFRKKTRRQGCG